MQFSGNSLLKVNKFIRIDANDFVKIFVTFVIAIIYRTCTHDRDNGIRSEKNGRWLWEEIVAKIDRDTK